MKNFKFLKLVFFEHYYKITKFIIFRLNIKFRLIKLQNMYNLFSIFLS